MTDNRRHGKMDNGGLKLKLPVYSSINIIAQNDSIEDAISTLDAAINASLFLPGDMLLMAYPILPIDSMRAGFFECNGTSIAKATYPILFDKIGYYWGGSGAMFSLPYLHGKFLRDWDDGVTLLPAGVDPGRIFGATQGFAMQDHKHHLTNTGMTLYLSIYQPLGCPTIPQLYTNTGGITAPITSALETRPINETLYALIKHD